MTDGRATSERSASRNLPDNSSVIDDRSYTIGDTLTSGRRPSATCLKTTDDDWPSTGFPLYFGGEIQGLFKDFQGPWSCIFKDQFSMEVYSMDSNI